jgi:hypothetical protein
LRRKECLYLIASRRKRSDITWSEEEIASVTDDEKEVVSYLVMR